MQSIRRSAFRAISSPSSSFLSTRSLTTSTPFVLRASKPATVSPVFRRYLNDDAENKNEESTFESVTEAAKETFSNATETVASGLGFAGRSRSNKEYEPRGPPRDLEPNPTIYVGNLLFEVTAADLEKIFSEFGTIKSALVAMDERGFSKGFGKVEFENVQQATAAIEAKDQTIFEGRRIIVNYQTKARANLDLKEPSKTLFIGNLAFEMSDQDLNNLFRDIRNVLDVRVAIDRRTGQPRGFAHADFVDTESAIKGLEFLQGKEVYGRRLRVDYSGPANTGDRSPRGDRRGNDRRGGRGGDRRGGDEVATF